ncbi:MAG: RagB/SusD family nutrient uptake outer membrane protein [Tannerellaceae bacterium]|jgi:hypothetical protein|nr:RagB/SusD family nutrient uptake outer membrane protein [Tannerellaceae bacterium]
MKTIIKSTVIIIALLFSACNESLFEKYPLSSPSDANFPTNETELQMALASCYNNLYYHPHDGVPFVMLLECVSDHGWDRNTSNLQEIGRGAHNERNSFLLDFWTRMYTGIARCNLLLANMESAEANTKPEVMRQVEGEARFLRAYYYFYLAELFGGVPLVEKPIALSESQVPKSTKEEIVQFLFKELDDAAGKLSSKNDPKEGRATKGAALALKSRIALYNKQWNVAVDAASQVMVMEGTEYELYPHYGDLFMYAGESSKETVFAINYLYGFQTNSLPAATISRIASGMSIKIPVQARIDSYECIDGLSIDKSPLYDPNTPFENRNPRLKFTCVVPGDIFYGYQFETNRDSLEIWDYNVSPPARIANTEATHDYASFSGYLWKKYCDGTVDFGARRGNSELNYMMIRYAEVLLNYAEAKIESGQIDDSALAAINKVRQRPSVEMPAITTKDQTALREAVRKERSYEFGGEGLRLFDIIRWGYSETVMNNTVLGKIPRGMIAAPPAIDERGIPDYSNVPNRSQMRVIEIRTFDKNKNYLWPIPFNEIQTNKELVQNPNYN